MAAVATAGTAGGGSDWFWGLCRSEASATPSPGWLVLGRLRNLHAERLALDPGSSRDRVWNVGLEVGDRILAVNGRRISVQYPLNVAMQTTNPGWAPLWARDWRPGQMLSVNVRLTRSRVHFLMLNASRADAERGSLRHRLVGGISLDDTQWQATRP